MNRKVLDNLVFLNRGLIGPMNQKDRHNYRVSLVDHKDPSQLIQVDLTNQIHIGVDLINSVGHRSVAGDFTKDEPNRGNISHVRRTY